MADVLGREVGFPADSESSALGAALLGMTALGMIGSLEQGAANVEIAHRHEARAAEAAIYAHMMGVFEGLYERLQSSFEALTELQPGIDRSASVEQ